MTKKDITNKNNSKKSELNNNSKLQTEYNGKIYDEVRFGLYYPCIVRSISDNKEELVIEYIIGGGKSFKWMVPSTVVEKIFK